MTTRTKETLFCVLACCVFGAAGGWVGFVRGYREGVQAPRPVKQLENGEYLGAVNYIPFVWAVARKHGVEKLITVETEDWHRLFPELHDCKPKD